MENGPNFSVERATKTIQFVENSLKKEHKLGAKSKLCEEYENFLLEEISLDKNEEDFVKEIKGVSEESEETQSGRDILVNLQKDIELNETLLQSNQDEIRRITFQDFANRQTYKSQFEDRKHEIHLYYSEAFSKMCIEFENLVKEHKLFEEKLKGQIAVEIGKKNIQLKEVKMTFQKNIAEKHGVLLSLLKEVNELRKTLEDLKTKKKTNMSQSSSSRRQNILWFDLAIPGSSSTGLNQPVQMDKNDLNTLNKSSSVELTTNSPTFQSKSVANVPLSQGLIDSSQKPISVPKYDSILQDDPWAFNETERNQTSSTSVNFRKVPKVYSTNTKRFRYQSK